ncbi:glycosyltransferase [Paenibacillus cisolokensis]|uniref:glycosyltransferase n=1 Tax=Paenibacillus cisolokensis TaxID=1658519 RepID=UPI003D26762A
MRLLNYGVERTSYFYSMFDNLLESDNYALYGSNIGDNGENLTITFLSLNRSELSIRLLKSIQEHLTTFKGEILIIDNGSEPSELNKLQSVCDSLSLRTRIQKLDKNYGVAGGRNRTMPYVQTEWVMCLDNDIYFINNPLAIIREEISLLGCHFINLPLLDSDADKTFALGGHLYVESYEGNINVGGGTCYKQINHNQLKQEVDRPFLSNFLFGGASILKKDTFIKLGGYDEQMFVGFEDIDLSIRLFREGYKIGNSCCFSLVHDHPKPSGQADIDYEKKRFSVKTIENSAKYLEDKYGYKIWDANLIKWLEEKNRNFGNDISISFNEQIVKKNPKAKIALVVDVDYWAFGNIARQIEKHLANDFSFDLISYEECDWDPVKLLFRTHDCDILHFFWREMIPQVFAEEAYANYLQDKAVSVSEFMNDYLFNKTLSTSVYDHLFLSEEEIVQRNWIFNQFHYYVCSEKLNEIYQSIQIYPNPKMVIEDGVDQELFYPINPNRFNEFTRPLVVGWVGNSKWAAEGLEDFKGFRTIVKPTVEGLMDQGVQVVGLYCDRVDGFVPHEEMVNYYAKIDVLVCMSKIEGTPNPVLEAMACGVPIITTDVGIVPQVLGPKQKEFIIEERSIDALKEKIIKLVDDRSILKQLSNENLEFVRPWYWENQCKKFKAYFETLIALKENKSRSR